VCGMPFIKADSADVTTYYDGVIAALGRVRAASVAPARDACRAALDDARDRRLERINPSYIVKNKPVVPPRPPRKKVVKPAQPVTQQDTSSSD
jgi:hypothetical protein